MGKFKTISRSRSSYFLRTMKHLWMRGLRSKSCGMVCAVMVLDFHAVFLKRFEVRLEGAQVAREDGPPALTEKTAHTNEKLHMIALHIPRAPSPWT